MISSTPPSNFSPCAEVAQCYIECHGEILLLQRNRYVKYPETWWTPGGKVDEWENFTRAAIRETFEETGIKLDQSKIKFLKKVYVQHKNHDILYYTHLYHIESKPDITLAPNEHQNYCWRTPEKALELELIEDEDLCIKKFFDI